MRIFLDANVLFSATKTAGARRNIEAKAAERLPDFERLLARLHVAEVQAHRAPMPALAKIVEKDRPVVAAAAAMRCGVLVTGDSIHFGTWFGRAIAGVVIHSPRSLYDELFSVI